VIVETSVKNLMKDVEMICEVVLLEGQAFAGGWPRGQSGRLSVQIQ